MADTKITDLTDLTAAADGDRLPIVDVSDTTMAASGTTKDITVANLATAIISAGSLATDAEVSAAVAAHTGDSTAAHAASAISFTPAGTIAGTDVQTAVAEVATDAATALAAHEAAGDPHPGYTTTGELATHAALTSSVHGISAFGATLVDDASAAAARTTLELGSLATLSAITTTQITDGTIIDGDISASAAIALSKLATDPRARSSHTGTQAASTISDFAEAVDDEVASLLVAGTNVTLTYNDAGNSLTIAASGGGGSSGTLSQRGQMTAYDGTAAFHGVPSFMVTTANSNFTLVADTLYFNLFFVDSDITINESAVEVVNNVGTTIRHGIVRLDASDRQPNSSGLVWQTTVSSATTGAKVSTGLSVALTAGIYATVFVCDGAAGIRRPRGALASTMFRLGSATNTAVAHTSRASVGTSAFADPVPDWTTVAAADTVDQFVGYRWS